MKKLQALLGALLCLLVISCASYQAPVIPLPPAIPAKVIPSDCTNDPPVKPGYRAFKGIDAYADTLAGVKTALVDVVKDFNAVAGEYIAPLEKKESTCRGGLKAQGE